MTNTNDLTRLAEQFKGRADDCGQLARTILAARDAQYAAMAGQEPVAEGFMAVDGKIINASARIGYLGVNEDDAAAGCRIVPLYTHPAPTNPAAQEPVARVNDEGFIVETGLLIEPGTLLYTHPYVQSELDAATERARDLVDGLNIKDAPAAQERAEPVAPAVGEAIAYCLVSDKGPYLADFQANFRPPSLKGELEEVIDRMGWDYGARFMRVVPVYSTTPPAPAQPEASKVKWDANNECWRLSAQPSTEPSKPEQAEAPSGEAARVDVHNLLRDADSQKLARATQLPAEQDCIRMMLQCRLRLEELGWNSGEYAPKDGSRFTGISAGYCGPVEFVYLGSGFFIADGGDWWPSPRPLVFKELS